MQFLLRSLLLFFSPLLLMIVAAANAPRVWAEELSDAAMLCESAAHPECTAPRTIPGRYRENRSSSRIIGTDVEMTWSWCEYSEPISPLTLCPNGGELIVISQGRVGRTKRCEYTYTCCFCFVANDVDPR